MNTKKVYMLPLPSMAATDTSNSIHQIVIRLKKHLPEYGFEITEDIEKADLTAAHAGIVEEIASPLAHVAHCHGLYPTGHPEFKQSNWHFGANRYVIQNLTHAHKITVPSQWVGDMLRRDMHLNPLVVPWAIEADEWRPGDNMGYVLWNKTRPDGVCDPKPLNQLAKLTPQQKFVTTFGEPATNVKVIGRQTYGDMQALVQCAAVYLATTKETFGIGTLEAMASGVPILGYRWGGTADIVEHGVTGYLVEPGDAEGLVDGLSYCLRYRAVLSANAILVAREYTWERVAQSFSTAYTLALRPQPPLKVSVVIPCFNYAHYVTEAIESAIQQKTAFKYEIIVVDDGSVDHSAEVVEQYFSKIGSQAALPSLVYPVPNGIKAYVTDNATGLDMMTVIRKRNGGVASARNAGVQAAMGDYIVCIDADDKLSHPLYLQTLATALDAEPELGIVFTALEVIDSAGKSMGKQGWPSGYDYDRQVQVNNQVPTCCMFRKEAWERAGGYRHYLEPAEDANLWLRIGALGYRGKQLTDEAWFSYRSHGASLSEPVRLRQQKEPNWRLWLPWVRSGQRPFAADGRPPKTSWEVRNYDQPTVAFVVSAGEDDAQKLRDTLDSIEGQSEWNWECFVVKPPAEVLTQKTYEWAKPCWSGFEQALIWIHASLTVFLEAGVLLRPVFMREVLKAYSRQRQVIMPGRMLSLRDAWRQHEAVIDVCAIPTEQARAAKLAEHKDVDKHKWNFYVLDKPLYYDARKLTNYRTAVKRIALEEPMCCGEQMTNGQNGMMQQGEAPADMELVRVEFDGLGVPLAPIAFTGVATGQYYGNRRKGDVFYVRKEDYEIMQNRLVLLSPDTQPLKTTAPPPPELRV